MDIRDIKKLIALCRKEGIEHLKVGELEITLGARPDRAARRKGKKGAQAHSQGEVEKHEDIKTEGDAPPSGDELLFWSAQGGLPYSVDGVPGEGSDQ